MQKLIIIGINKDRTVASDIDKHEMIRWDRMGGFWVEDWLCNIRIIISPVLQLSYVYCPWMHVTAQLRRSYNISCNVCIDKHNTESQVALVHHTSSTLTKTCLYQLPSLHCTLTKWQNGWVWRWWFEATQMTDCTRTDHAMTVADFPTGRKASITTCGTDLLPYSILPSRLHDVIMPWLMMTSHTSLWWRHECHRWHHRRHQSKAGGAACEEIRQLNLYRPAQARAGQWDRW